MEAFDRKLLDILGCPTCKQALELRDGALSCDSCKTQYPIINGVPVFRGRNRLYDERYYKDGGELHGKGKRPGWKNLVRVMIKKATPSCRETSRRSRDILLSYLREGSPDDLPSVILNIGPGKTRDMQRLLKECGSALRLCVDLEENADIVGDIRYLPFQDGTVDFVFAIAVLEHVDDPAKAVEDMHRSLTPNGKIYAEIPFCRSYHPLPCDFQRYTISGIEKLFEGFQCLEKGVASGPGSTMSLAISSFFAILLSFGNVTWYKLLNRIFRIVTKPMQYVDLLFQKNELAHRLACAVYILCQKNS